MTTQEYNSPFSLILSIVIKLIITNYNYFKKYDLWLNEYVCLYQNITIKFMYKKKKNRETYSYFLI